MDDKLNYFGAGVFWLYNVAALVLTGVVIVTILELRQNNSKRKRTNVEQQSRLFVGLASLSFAVLSFNMLHVLIQSFNEWLQRHPRALEAGYGHAVWHWSITSTLFQDFGNEIVADNARCMWTLSELLATFSICLFMGLRGYERRVPRLWAFFGLSQILPISFAQNLFYLALLSQQHEISPDAPPHTVERTMMLSSVVVVAYGTCLSFAQASAGTNRLIPLILLTRSLLVTPMLLPYLLNLDSRHIGSKAQFGVTAFAVATFVSQLVRALLDHTPLDIIHAVTSHPAVSALGIDFVISVASFAAWMSIATAPSSQAASEE